MPTSLLLGENGTEDLICHPFLPLLTVQRSLVHMTWVGSIPESLFESELFV